MICDRSDSCAGSVADGRRHQTNFRTLSEIVASDCYKNLVPPAAVIIGSTAATTVTLISDTSITLVAPAGVGVGHTISGTFDGDPSIGNLQFTYDAPVVTHVDPGNGPTIGGNFITIRGNNFGKSSEIGLVSASIGNTACTTVAAVTDHVAVKCQSSGGYGIALPVRVTVASQLSNVNLVFSYDIPVITAVVPNVAGTIASTAVTILGRNFGEASAGRSARIGNTAVMTGMSYEKTRLTFDNWEATVTRTGRAMP